MRISESEKMDSVLLKDDSVFKKHIDKAKALLSGAKAEEYKKLTTRYRMKLHTS